MTNDSTKKLIYLASPYKSADPLVVDYRRRAVTRAMAQLTKSSSADNIYYYSPIVHNHQLAITCTLPKTWEFWREHDFLVLSRCDGIAVLELEGWEESEGVQAELAFARGKGIPLVDCVSYDNDEAMESVSQNISTATFFDSNETAIALNLLAARIHELNKCWWHDLETGEPLARNRGELLMLMVSEIAEAMEGERRSLMDDHLPDRRMAEVELADAVIRVMDYAAGFGYDIGGALFDKLRYNTQRADHKAEARKETNGKKF